MITIELSAADVQNLLVACDQAGRAMGLKSFAVFAELASKLEAATKEDDQEELTE